jgi:hypothetical protein
MVLDPRSGIRLRSSIKVALPGLRRANGTVPAVAGIRKETS